MIMGNVRLMLIMIIMIIIQHQQQPKQPQQPSVGDCKLHPDELSCPQPKKSTQPNHPDDCLFNPNLNKCNPDQNGNCPSGFSLNGREQCIPYKACPSGFIRHNDDETRTCYPVIKEQQQQTPPQSQPQQQPTTSVVVIKQPVIVKTRVETTVKNFITNNIFSSSGTTITANTGTFTTQQQQQQHNQPTDITSVIGFSSNLPTCRRLAMCIATKPV
jgi:hypothetical protein